MLAQGSGAKDADSACPGCVGADLQVVSTVPWLAQTTLTKDVQVGWHRSQVVVWHR